MVNFPDSLVTQLVVVNSNNQEVIVIGPGPEIDIIDPTSGVTLVISDNIEAPGASTGLPGFRWEMPPPSTDPEIVAVLTGDQVGQLFMFSGGFDMPNPSTQFGYARVQLSNNNASIGIVDETGAGLGGRLDTGDQGLVLTAFDSSTPDQINNRLIVTGTGVTVQDAISVEGETWHDVVFQNGWTNLGSGFSNVQYRKEPDGTIRLRGYGKAGTKTNGTVLFQLPAGYRPPAKKNLVGSADATISPFVWTAQINSATDPSPGNVACFSVGSAGVVCFDGMTCEVA